MLRKLASLHLCWIPLLFTSVAALATPGWNQKSAFWVTYRVPALFAGKTVTGAFAHTGILRTGGQPCGQGGFQAGDWQDVQHLPMSREGDHFFAKTRLNGDTGYCQVGIRGPVVQFWLSFDDGSTSEADPIDVPYTDTTIRVLEPQPNGQLDWDASATANDQSFATVADAPIPPIPNGPSAPSASASRLQFSWATDEYLGL